MIRSLEQVFAGRSPAEAAKQVVAGSKLADVSVRRVLADGRRGCDRKIR